jgi:hypothetical protein
LFELLTGARPYSARNAYEWILIHNQATPPDLQPHGVPPQLARVVKRMLSRVPAQRQQTMREVIQDLRTAGRTQKNIPAFASEGTQVAPGGLTTNLLAASEAAPHAAASAYPAPSYQAPIQLPAPPGYGQPTPQPSYGQPTPQPSYLQPAPGPGYSPAPPSYQPQAPGPGYSQGPPPGYQQQAPGPGYSQGPPPSYQPAPYSQSPLSADPMRRARLMRLGEFLLGVAVVIIYLVIYWQDTLTFLRTFAKSLRFGL